MKLRKNEKIVSKKSGKMYLGQRLTTVTTNQRIVKLFTLYSLYTAKEFRSFVHNKNEITPKFQNIVSSSVDYNYTQTDFLINAIAKGGSHE